MGNAISQDESYRTNVFQQLPSLKTLDVMNYSRPLVHNYLCKNQRKSSSEDDEEENGNNGAAAIVQIVSSKSDGELSKFRIKTHAKRSGNLYELEESIFISVLRFNLATFFGKFPKLKLSVSTDVWPM